MNAKKFVEFDPAGNPWGVVSTEQLWGNVYALKYSRPEKRLSEDQWRSLLHRANQAAIEYQCDVSKLPSENGTPLLWKTAQELGWTAQELVGFTKEILTDALEKDPNEKPEDFIQDWLHPNEFTYGLGCIGIGFFNKKPGALVVAQVKKETGWSRLSYMGLVPELRSKGLGKWVHRHGFEMMKAQGGKLYHGGTHTEYHPMRKLFEFHGCHAFCEMEEWSMKMERGAR